MASTTTDRLAGVTASLASKVPVAAATTGNITLSGEQTLDAVPVVADNRALVKNQTDGIENGIYDVKSGAWVRSLDFDGTRDIKSGTFVLVAGGGQSGTLWRVTTANDIVIGTTSIAFTQMTVESATAFIVTLLDDVDSAAALATLVAAGTAIINTFTKVQTFSAAPVWAKGADIASASPLVLGTDGIWFDVTGTTGFSQITVVKGTWFMLQFDAVLTMTDGANLDLGGVDITTAAGDRAIFFATAANTVELLAYKHVAAQRVINSHAKIGATSGWAVNAADDLGLLATCPASQTNSTLVMPISGLKVGDKITAFSVVGQIESAGGTVTLDADLRKMTAAAADVADASVGTITQISVTADAIISASKTGLTEVVAADETFYVLLTATTAASTDIALQGVTITISES